MNSNTAKTLTEADQIRNALKAAGYSRKQITVRYDGYSMGATVHVTIRDHKVSRAVIEALCAPFESVRRDEQGSILEGGNTFVDVEYGRGVLDLVAAPIANKLAAAELGVTIEIDGLLYVKLADGAYGGTVIQGVDADGCADTRRMNAHCGRPDVAADLMFAARQIAERAIAVADIAASSAAAEAVVFADAVEVVKAADSTLATSSEDADVVRFLTAVGAL